MPSPLLEDIIENRCIPIIGAGFSRNATTPSGFQMPLWDDVAKHFSKQLGENYSYVSPLDPISDYCHKFGKAKVVEQLRTILHIGKINVSPAHLAFADLPFDTIITTNFDFLLEMAYEQKSRQHIPILGEDQLSISKLSSDNNITTILKIHGDLNHPNKMVITEEDYDAYTNDHPLMSTYIANLLITRTPLFIGYSLDDPDFRGIWQIVKSRLGKLQRYAYALSNQVNDTKITKFERRGINVITIGG